MCICIIVHMCVYYVRAVLADSRGQYYLSWSS